MGSLQLFQIFLDEHTPVYLSGQKVSGRVELHLSAPKQLRGVRLKFKGAAEVRWSESKSRGRGGSSRVTYRAEEQYFSEEHYTIGNPDENLTLAAGAHVFPFAFVLPPHLPSSFEGEFGHVRYTIKATVDRPWKFDHEAKAIFTVIQHLDLNAEQSIKEPVELLATKYLCCLWCRSGPISLEASLPGTGYVPGQEIEATVKTTNATTQPLEVSASLIQDVAYHATTKTRHMNAKVCELLIGSVPARGTGSWRRMLQVPPVPPSFLRNCNIIDINYKLEVTAHIPGPHRKLSVDFPVVIGTIPLAMYVPPVSNPPQQPNAGQPSAPPYPDIEPPSYEECIQGKRDARDEEDNEYTRGEMGFAPRYPTYQPRR